MTYGGEPVADDPAKPLPMANTNFFLSFEPSVAGLGTAISDEGFFINIQVIGEFTPVAVFPYMYISAYTVLIVEPLSTSVGVPRLALSTE